MKQIYKRPESLKDAVFRFCPGCGHSILHKLIAQCIDEFGIREKTIGIAPVGCAVFAYDYFNFDVIECAHGRPPAVATALKRVMPDRFVFSYQGDGDLASIGMAEIIHAANRGENLSVIFVNNANYGMTGGQMAPTTLTGMKTSTTPRGRRPEREGYPLQVSEILSQIEGVSFIARTALDGIKGVKETKAMIKKAFRYQLENKGFSFVEVLSPCPTDWGISPKDSFQWVKSSMEPVFKTGTLKDRYAGENNGKH
ncbi:MAG: 2-oxoglutarate oxidoreductase [Nitrospirae bacterium]|nr:MAG: 2-oxoglutarate oxidoreductase [Nitrospirota bacterium]